MHPNWHDISYLQSGNQRQQAAFRVLQALDVFHHLRAFSPVLVGTIPLEIDVSASDLDIICEVHDFAGFAQHVQCLFHQQAGFCLKQRRVNGVASIVVAFHAAHYPLELFGQPQPVTRQHAYRHLLVEYRLLQLGGDAARQTIRRLKQAGLQTESAFADHFNLAGDPYDALLHLAALNDHELQAIIARRQAIR